MSGNRSKSAFFEGVGHFERRFQREGGIAHQPLLVSENESDCRFVWYQNIRSALFSFLTIHASDGQTDRRRELREQYRALHYMQSHGKNGDNTAPCMTPEPTLKKCDQLLFHLTHVRQLDIQFSNTSNSALGIRRFMSFMYSTLWFILSKALDKSIAQIFIVLLHII